MMVSNLIKTSSKYSAAIPAIKTLIFANFTGKRYYVEGIKAKEKFFFSSTPKDDEMNYGAAFGGTEQRVS